MVAVDDGEGLRLKGSPMLAAPVCGEEKVAGSAPVCPDGAPEYVENCYQ